MATVKVTTLRSWNMNAPDLEAAVRFYRDVLGADVRESQTIAGAKVSRLRIGSLGIGIFDASAGPRPGVPHHTFQVDGPAQAAELVAQLKQQDVEVESVRQHRGGNGYSVYVFDPAGNRLELSVGEG